MFRTLIKGTFILTITGLITRLIGFIYKIYLSNLLGARMLGIYQLVFPVYAICFTIFGAGIQTAVSSLVARKPNDIRYHRKILYVAGTLSLITAAVLSLIIYLSSDHVAIHVLGEPECAGILKYLIYAFPACAVSATINGCYYGIKKAAVPALTQLIEQIARVAFVVMFSTAVKDLCLLAVIGICVGETVSMIYSVFMIGIRFRNENNDSVEKNENNSDNNYSNAKTDKNMISDKILSTLLKLSIPLTANKLIIALLNSLELIMIPVMLKKYGMTSDQALSIFGVLTGMAIPFILFPSTITNSLSVLLLPTISEVSAYRSNEEKDAEINHHTNADVKRISRICIISSIALGIASTVFFETIGAKFGEYVFHNETVSIFIQILAFLCPFMFLATTLTSIINGLGKTHITFMITALSLAVRILITMKLVPVNGISGYLISLLVSQLMATALSYRYYRRIIDQRP